MPENVQTIAPLQAAGNEPGHAAAWSSRGIALARAGRFADATEAFRKALALAPGHVVSTAYLGICLGLGGDDESARELLDYEAEIDEGPLFPGLDDQALREFNRELVDHVRRHPTLRWQPPDKATHGGSQTAELLADDSPPVIRRLAAGIRQRLQGLLGDEDEALQAQRLRLTLWAVSLKSGGYQEPHVHQAGLLSGVYYAQVPRSREHPEAGALRFPRQLPWLPGRTGTAPSRLVLPTPGTLVLFPSYFWHETVPFAGDEERVSFAFDVLSPLE